jgi:hypothetical protein
MLAMAAMHVSQKMCDGFGLDSSVKVLAWDHATTLISDSMLVVAYCTALISEKTCNVFRLHFILDISPGSGCLDVLTNILYRCCVAS